MNQNPTPKKHYIIEETQKKAPTSIPADQMTLEELKKQNENQAQEFGCATCKYSYQAPTRRQEDKKAMDIVAAAKTVDAK